MELRVERDIVLVIPEQIDLRICIPGPLHQCVIEVV